MNALVCTALKRSWARAFGSAAAVSPLPRTERAVRDMGVRKGNIVSVVLKEQLDNLGYKGAEVTVTPGYARNYLVPYGKAVYATDAHRQKFKVVLPQEEAKANALQRELNMLRARVGRFTLEFSKATNDGVHLYGSVNAADICESLSDSVLRKLNIREANVRFTGESQATNLIKVIGRHTVEIEPRPDLWCAFTVIVNDA